MKYAFLLLVFFIASISHAAERNYKSFFAHPDAQIIITIGTAHSKAVPYKNHSIPKTSQQAPVFQDGFGTSGDRPNVFVQWRFIEKTEYGDLYLFAVKRDDALVKAFSALYYGATVIAYDHDDIRVTIETYADEP